MFGTSFTLATKKLVYKNYKTQNQKFKNSKTQNSKTQNQNPSHNRHNSKSKSELTRTQNLRASTTMSASDLGYLCTWGGLGLPLMTWHAENGIFVAAPLRARVDAHTVLLEPLCPDSVLEDLSLLQRQDGVVQIRTEHERQRLVRHVCVERPRLRSQHYT